jgi:hypothetical protein
MRAAILSLFAAVAVAASLFAQSPAPVVVPAAPPAATAKPDPSIAAALKMLQEMKAANEETLRKQAATLQQLDVIEKEANEIRIYTKRS